MHDTYSSNKDMQTSRVGGRLVLVHIMFWPKVCEKCTHQYPPLTSFESLPRVRWRQGACLCTQRP